MYYKRFLTKEIVKSIGDFAREGISLTATIEIVKRAYELSEDFDTLREEFEEKGVPIGTRFGVSSGCWRTHKDHAYGQYEIVGKYEDSASGDIYLAKNLDINKTFAISAYTIAYLIVFQDIQTLRDVTVGNYFQYLYIDVD